MPAAPLSATELWPFAVKYVKNRSWKLDDDGLTVMNELAREVRFEREESARVNE